MRIVNTLPVLIILVLFVPAAPMHAGVLAGEQGENTIFLPLISRQLPPPVWLGPDGGRVVVTVIDPANPQTVYAGTWGAGLFKSSDGGATWVNSSSGLGNRYINSLAIDPRNPTVLYAGTYTDGIYKTTDGARSWFHANQGVQDLAVVYTIAVDPTDPNRVYAGTRSGSPLITNRPWHGIAYRSDDGGLRWSPMSGTDNIGGDAVKDWFYSIAVNPSAPNILLAAAHESAPYRSTDFGQTWSPAKDGIINCGSPQDDGCHGRSIVYDPRAEFNGTAYLGTWRGNGVYLTSDNGETWDQRTAGLYDTDFYRLAIDSISPSTLYGATFGGKQISSGVVKSTDSGESWSLAGLKGTLIYTVEVDPGNSAVLYAGTLGSGLYKSTDGGSSWFSSQRGLINTGVAATVVNPGDSNVLYTALNENGVACSLDGGQTWRDYSAGLGDRSIHAMASPLGPRSNILYALTDQAGVFALDTKVGVWKPTAWVATAPAAEKIAFEPGHPLADRETLLGESEYLHSRQVDATTQASVPLLSLAIGPPPNTYLMYVGTAGLGVYRTYDGGGRWEAAGLSGMTVWSLAANPQNGSHLYAATNTPGIVPVSTNEGSSWNNTSLPDPGLMAYVVMFSPANPQVVYAGTSNGLYRRNSTEDWLLLGLQGMSVTALAEQPGNPARIYAGTTDGLQVSSDSGMSWQSGSEWLDEITVQTITVDPNDPHILYVGTRTHGTLRLNLP